MYPPKVPVQEIHIGLTIDKLVATKGYPACIQSFQLDYTWSLRGLAVDKKRGNFLKLDRFKSRTQPAERSGGCWSSAWSFRVRSFGDFRSASKNP